jgi:ribosomal protein L20A (L18A)
LAKLKARPSVSYCYSIRIQFKKEIPELAKEKTSVFEKTIKNLGKRQKLWRNKIALSES